MNWTTDSADSNRNQNCISFFQALSFSLSLSLFTDLLPNRVSNTSSVVHYYIAGASVRFPERTGPSI